MDQICIPGLCQHRSYRNCSTVLIISFPRQICGSVIEKSAFQTEFKWHGNNLALIHMIIFHKTKSRRSVSQNNACKSFLNCTSVCLTCRTRHRNTCCTKVSSLRFARVTCCQINQLFYRQCIDKFHCLLICKFPVFLINNLFCLKVCSFHLHNRKMFLCCQYLLISLSLTGFSILLRQLIQFLFFCKKILCLLQHHTFIQLHATNKLCILQTVSNRNTVETFFQDPCRAFLIIRNQTLCRNLQSYCLLLSRLQQFCLRISSQTMSFFFKTATRQRSIYLHYFFSCHISCVFHICCDLYAMILCFCNNTAIHRESSIRKSITKSIAHRNSKCIKISVSYIDSLFIKFLLHISIIM